MTLITKYLKLVFLYRFMGQMCSSVPQSLMTLKPEVTEIAARLSTSFFIETFIHAKEKVRTKYKYIYLPTLWGFILFTSEVCVK